MNKLSRLRQLGNDSLIYGLGGTMAKGVSFLLLPIYTRMFSPAEYGAIEMLAVVTSFVSTVLVMGMDSAQSFFFFEEKANGKAAQVRVVSAILQWRLIWGGGIVAIATVMAPLLSAWLFNGALTWHYFALAFFGAFFSQIMGQCIDLFRLLYRPWPYVLILFAYAVSSAACVLVLVLVYDQGILGYFLGAALAAFVIGCLSLYLVREYLDFTGIFVSWWPRVVRFGLPLLPAGLAFSIMSMGDRWFIQHYHGDAALGVYAVGAKFALLITLAVETFRKAWWPIAMDAMHCDDGAETFRMIARLYMGIGMAGLVQLTFISPWLVDWLAAPEYRTAWLLVGVLTWQSVFYGFYMVVSAGIFKAEKTYLAMYLMIGAALFNVALNFLLVPTFGGMGAAIATAIAYAAWIGASMLVSERLWRVEFPAKLIVSQVCIGVLFVFWYLMSFDLTPTLVQAAIAFLTSLSLVLISLNQIQRQYVLRYVQSRICGFRE